MRVCASTTKIATKSDRIPCTSAARTLFDLSRSTEPGDARRQHRRRPASRARHVDELRHRATRLATKGRPGGRRFRAAVDARSIASTVPGERSLSACLPTCSSGRVFRRRPPVRDPWRRRRIRRSRRSRLPRLDDRRSSTTASSITPAQRPTSVTAPAGTRSATSATPCSPRLRRPQGPRRAARAVDSARRAQLPDPAREVASPTAHEPFRRRNLVRGGLFAGGGAFGEAVLGHGLGDDLGLFAEPAALALREEHGADEHDAGRRRR